MAYNPTNFIQAQQLTETSTVQKHPLGTVVKANDPTFGEGEFIYLKGVASTAVGDVVAFSLATGTTTRCLAATRGPLAIAMSANVANQYGWYCIRGNVPVSAAGAVVIGAVVYLTATAGAVDDAVTAGSGVSGITFTTAPSGVGTFAADVFYPTANGLA